MSKLYKKLLMIPLWPLYNMESLEDINYDNQLADYLKDGYKLEARKDIYNSLVWAKQNPNYNFLDIMKNAPNRNVIKFKNNEVYTHLIKFKEFMEKEEFSLLTYNGLTYLDRI